MDDLCLLAVALFKLVLIKVKTNEAEVLMKGANVRTVNAN